MKKELEVKILEIDEAAIRARLVELGARLEFDGCIQTASYEFSDVNGKDLYLSGNPDGTGLLVLTDRANGSLLRTTVTDRTEMIDILDKIGLENQNDRWFAHKPKPLANRGYRLRLRRLSDAARGLDFGQLTLKTDKSVDAIKRMNEYETEVSPFTAAREIFLRFGMREFRPYGKDRAEYHLLGGVKVVIDREPKIPAYLEVEGPDDTSIENCVALLGHTMADTCTLTGREVRELYAKRRG